MSEIAQKEMDVDDIYSQLTWNAEICDSNDATGRGRGLRNSEKISGRKKFSI
jgi:hypothetical protein